MRHANPRNEQPTTVTRVQSRPEPIANPAILGIYAYAGSIMTIAPWLAGLYGTKTETPPLIAPFVGIFGGIAQLSASVWAFRSRQWLTTFITSAWAMEHMAWCIMYLLIAAGVFKQPQGPFPALAMWYLALAWVSVVGAIAAIKMTVLTAVSLSIGAAGAVMAGTGEMYGIEALQPPSGWILMASSAVAWYNASAMMLQSAYGREVLPIWRTGTSKQAAQISGGEMEPGVTLG